MGDHFAKVWSDSDKQIPSFIFRAYNDEMLFFSLCGLVLVLITDPLTIKRMLTLRHPYTRASFLCQGLQSDTGKCMLASPPASPLPKYGRNRIMAGRRSKTQLKRVIWADVCLVRHPCHNRWHWTVNTYRDPSPSKRHRPRLRLLTS